MQNSIYKIKYLLFLSWDWEAWCLTVWGGGIPPLKETLLEIRGGNVYHCLGAPNHLIRPWVRVVQIIFV